ncbi:MAG: sigma-54-dependent Fis family transcriptional regulator [Archangium sp.]|nr:sigma-54-dependent Fis family transcriptional regulator [Archangium sp.]MDP3571602.1 sigma-54-dependent Fis family transcriptional regulator [Archangium sp.]
MRARNLKLTDIFDFDADGGEMTLAGERVVLMDAVAMGLLRSQLITAFGMTGARSIFTRFGYTHGYRLAEAMKTAIPWEDEREWRVAGGRLHRLHGMVSFEPVKQSTHSPPPFAEAVWHDSYEADQHLLHHGQAEECVCWTLAGFASGYLSKAQGRTVYCIEESCRGKGDPVCRMVGRFREDWPEAQQAFFTFYESDCLNEALSTLQAQLKKVDRRLAQRRRELESEQDESGLVIRSLSMKTLLGQARRVASVDTSVLLQGESGAGKERIARFIHDASGRQAGPFVAINCAAVPESLIESELFGHARGSFTGATSDRPGLFESAKGGTLLLDEVAELPLPMQSKLLRVLQEREVRRVGENKTRSIDVRLIAATHRDLAAEVKANRFREDLFFRLRVIELQVPPLRERPEDILPLARQALARSAAREKLPLKELSPEASRRVLAHPWPGNVRELLNAMERALVLSPGKRIEASDLPPDVKQPAAPARHLGEQRTLAEIEREAILTTLAAERGSRARTAERLAIGQATLFRKLKQYQAEGHQVAPAA